MKHVLTLVLLLALAVPALVAQPTTSKVYRDSLTATGVTTTAKTTAGYDTYIRLRTDIAAYRDKMLGIKFSKVTDSVQVQGGYVDFGADTVWTTLNITPNIRKVGAYIAGIVVPQALKDTTMQWLTPVTNDQNKFIIPMDKFFFPFYRVVSGLNDSGKTYITDIRRGGY